MVLLPEKKSMSQAQEAQRVKVRAAVRHMQLSRFVSSPDPFCEVACIVSSENRRSRCRRSIQRHCKEPLKQLLFSRTIRVQLLGASGSVCP